MRHKVVLAVLSALALLAGACSDSDESAESDDDVRSEQNGDAASEGAEIEVAPAEHRVVVSDDGNLFVLVPVDDETEVSVDVLDPSEWPEFLAGAQETPGVTVYDLQPSGVTFDEPVQVFRRVEVANLDLEDPEAMDIPLITMFTTDQAGAPELMDAPRILRTPDAVWVGGATDHFSPAITVNEQDELGTDDVFRELLASVTDAEGNQVIPVERLVDDPPEVPEGPSPPVLVTDGSSPDGDRVLDPFGDVFWHVELGEIPTFEPPPPDSAGEGIEIVDVSFEPLAPQFGDVRMVTDELTGEVRLATRIGSDRLPGTTNLLGEAAPDFYDLTVGVALSTHAMSREETSDLVEEAFAMVLAELDAAAPEALPTPEPTPTPGPPSIPDRWELRLVVVHGPLGPFPSYVLVRSGTVQPLPPGVFVSTIETSAEPGADTALVDPVLLPEGVGPNEVETGIECFCDYGLAVIGPTELPLEEIEALETVGAVHDAGAPVSFLTGPDRDFTLAPVGPDEGTIFEGFADRAGFVP